jgi:hypothetical protein
MANALTSTAKSAWATHSSSGSLGTPALRSTGKADSTEIWKRVQEQACRALVSDPDIVFYHAFLASNSIYKKTTPLSEKIDALALAAEGSAFKTVAVAVPASTVVPASSQTTETLQRTVDSLIQRAAAVAPASKLGKRQAVRGDEALAEYRAGLDPFLLAYKEVRTKTVLLSNLHPFSFEGYRKYALATPLSRADAALSTEYSTDASSSFVAQNASAAAALTTLSRLPFLDYRVKYDQAFSPESLSLSFSGTTGTFAKGSPGLAFVRVGDLLQSTGGTAVVTGVSATTITIDTAVVVNGAFSLVPAHLSSLKTLMSSLRSFLSATDDVTTVLREQLARLNDAAATNSVIEKLAQIQAAISGLSPTMSAILTRRGIAAPSGTALQTSLLAYAPAIPKRTRESALAIVDVLERNGFSHAATRILAGDTTVLLGSAESAAPGFGLGAEKGALQNAGNE